MRLPPRYIQYGASIIEGTVPKRLKEKIVNCDRRGLRMCIGALPRTSNLAIREESSLEPLETLLKRSVLRTGVRLLFTPELSSVWNTITDASLNPGTYRLDCNWLEQWMMAGIARQRSREEALSFVFHVYPRTKKKKWKYFTGSFWRERMMARFRMGVLPTRAWAFSMKLSVTDECRHCHQEQETIDHLLVRCCAVNRNALMSVWHTVLEMESDFSAEGVSNFLNNDFRRSALEQELITFIRMNDLFKRE